MAWIEVHQALRDHRKVLALSETLDMPEPHVAGHLIYLWLWALDNAPDGTLPASTRIIARAAGWTANPDNFVAALISAGFIDDEDGTWSVHHWAAYAGKLLDRRKANAEKQARWRDRQQPIPPNPPLPPNPQQSAPADRNPHVTVTSPSRNGATVPNRTVPYPTERETRARTRGDLADALPAPDNGSPSLSLSAHASQATAEAEADAPLDPLDVKEATHRLLDAWTTATGIQPRSSSERRSWTTKLTEMARDVGLSPPECAPLVRQYRAKFGTDKSPTPGQVAAVYSQLGVSPDVQPVLPPGRRPPPPPTAEMEAQRAAEHRARAQLAAQFLNEQTAS